MYIGEAENIQERLIQHIRDYSIDKEKYFWNTAVLFTGRDLNKALIRYLENRFVELTRTSKRYLVLTKNAYRNTAMKKSQIAVMEEFIDDAVLSLNVGNAQSRAMITTEGFVLIAGATVNEKTIAKSLSVGMVKLRKKILESGRGENKNIEMETFYFTIANKGIL